MRDIKFKQALLCAAVSSSLMAFAPLSTAESLAITNTDINLELANGAERASREKRAAIGALWTIGRAIRPLTTLVRPLSWHRSTRVVNVARRKLASRNITLPRGATVATAAQAIGTDAAVLFAETEAAAIAVVHNPGGIALLEAADATIFTQLPEITAIEEGAASEEILHAINIPIVETMALVEGSELYPIAENAGEAMKQVFASWEAEFNSALQQEIQSGSGYVGWSNINAGFNPAGVVGNEVRALTGRWATNFELGEYNAITKKVDLRIRIRGGIDTEVQGSARFAESRHILNVAKRLHRTNVFNIENFNEVATAATQAGQYSGELELLADAQHGAITRGFTEEAGAIIEHDGRRFIVTDQEYKGFKRLADVNGNRVRSNLIRRDHVFLAEHNGQAVPVFQENGGNGVYRLFDNAKTQPEMLGRNGKVFSAIGEPKPQPNLTFTSEQANNLKSIARSHLKQLKEVDKLGKRKIGPVVSVAQDLESGTISKPYINNFEGTQPSNLHNILDRRFNIPDADLEEYAFSKGKGSHAEVYAVNDLLNQRPNATLDDFAVFTMETQKKGFVGEIKPPCIHCKWILGDVQYVD